MSGGGPDGQLNRLRNMNGTGGMMMTEYNPNYEFGGGTCTIQDLKEIPRENLRLVKEVNVKFKIYELLNIFFTKFRNNYKSIFQFSFHIGHLGKEHSVKCTKDILRKI